MRAMGSSDVDGSRSRSEWPEDKRLMASLPSISEGAFTTQSRDILRRVFWNGGSTFDAWLNAASFQVSQVLLNFPYSFAQMGLVPAILFQLLYASMGCWVSYIMTSLYLTYKDMKEKQNVSLANHTVQFYEVMDELLGAWGKGVALFVFFIGLASAAMIQIVSCASAAYYINNNLDKRTWTLVLGPCLFLVLLIPSPRNYRMWSFVGIVMTTYVAWYLTIAAAIHGQEGVRHSGPTNMVHFFTGAGNILYASGGHGLTVEMAGSMWKPSRFKVAYFYAVLYVLTLTVPSASMVYWAFGDRMLVNTNAFAVLPRTKFRDAAVILIICHQFFEFGLLALPFCFMCEKLMGVHHSKHYLLKVATRVPVFLAIWFCAILMPFFGPIDSINGAFFVSVAVFILPCFAHMIVYRSAETREKSVERPPFWLRSWVGVYCVNLGVILWVLIVGVGFGGWASISNMAQQIHKFGLFVKCYQCRKK